MKTQKLANVTEKIPEVMKEISNWVCRTKDKMPINPHTGTPAKANDNTTWSDYQTACNYADNNPGKVVGIGFELTENSGIIGVDIDHCLKDGKFLNDKIKEFIDMVKSYIEYSPSGEGLHIYLKGTWPTNVGNKKKLENNIVVEVYNNKRYFTVTGNAYNYGTNKEILEEPNIIEYLLTNFFNEPKVIVQADTVNTCNENNEIVDYEERIVQLLETDKYFRELWEGKRPKLDESSNDMALLCALIKNVTCNKEELKNLFLSSPHVKSKDKKHEDKVFKRVDYLERSINRALAYSDRNIENIPNDIELLDFKDNDSGNADKFKFLFGKYAAYNTKEKCWFVYSDGYWHKDFGGEINEMAERLYQRFSCVAEWSGERNKMAAAYKLGNEATRGTMLKSAQSKMKLANEKFNQHRNLLAVKNGIVDLKTCQLMNFSPEYYISLKVDINYNPNAGQAMNFLKYLKQISDDDKALANYILYVLGYCLTGDISEQVFFILYGAGSNGKSVLVNLLSNLFGDLVGTLAQDAFLENTGSLNPSLVQAKDCRMVFVNETNRRDRLNTALLKGISGGDIMKVRTLYSDLIEFRPQCKIIFITNHLPNIDWNDRAMLRRTKIIPFRRNFSGDNCDPDLLSKLLQEKEEILALLVKVASEWYKRRLPQEVECMINCLNERRRNDDSVYAFMEDCVEITNNDDNKIKASQFFGYYKNYCEESNIFPVTNTAFGLWMNNKKVTKRMYGKERSIYYFGIKYIKNEQAN